MRRLIRSRRLLRRLLSSLCWCHQRYFAELSFSRTLEHCRSPCSRLKYIEIVRNSEQKPDLTHSRLAKASRAVVTLIIFQSLNNHIYIYNINKCLYIAGNCVCVQLYTRASVSSILWQSSSIDQSRWVLCSSWARTESGENFDERNTTIIYSYKYDASMSNRRWSPYLDVHNTRKRKSQLKHRKQRT